MRQRRKERRERLIALAGGKCVRCGSIDQLQFDHIDSTQKSFILSGCYIDKAWEKVMEEFAKCQLLCHPCHRIKTIECNETGGGHNKGYRGTDYHGTESGYNEFNCRCVPCGKARYNARVARGELKGTGRSKYANPL
jgi:hypothetical protein